MWEAAAAAALLRQPGPQGASPALRLTEEFLCLMRRE